MKASYGEWQPWKVVMGTPYGEWLPWKLLMVVAEMKEGFS